MGSITRIGTYLPTWGSDRSRSVGDDEDAVTLGVAAGRAALEDSEIGAVNRVVFVTRDFPLLEGGNAAPLLAGLGLDPGTSISELLGGAPAVLDTITGAADGTLIIGADVRKGAGASAILCAAGGTPVTAASRISRNMPVTTRNDAGETTDYADARLLRERGLGESMTRLGSPHPIAVAGLGARDSAAIADGLPLMTTGASSLGFALAVLAEQGAGGPVMAVEQATITLADLSNGSISVTRNEPSATPRPGHDRAPGAAIAISLAAYDRAFDAKLRLEAARCVECGELSYPPRYRCIECESEAVTEPFPLPRSGEVYSVTTIRVPVPGLISPYTIAIIELLGTRVRTLVRLTGAEPGSIGIGDRGSLVFRLVAVRSGVPDYGYGFLPDPPADDAEVAA
jgi:uncharacterized OB-fold protein